MVAGRAEEAPATTAAILRRRYLNTHPSAETFVNFKDLSFWIRPSGAHLVAGFGRIVDLSPAQFLTDISDCSALLEAEQDAIDHMNADHRDTMNLYATRLLGADLRIGAAPAAIPMASTCRPAPQRSAGFSAADRHRRSVAAGVERSWPIRPALQQQIG